MGRDRWTAEEYRRYLETGKEPGMRVIPEEALSPQAKQHFEDVRGFYAERDAETEALKQEIAQTVDRAARQQRIEEAYARAEREGRVMALDIYEQPDGGVRMEYAGRVDPPKVAKFRNEKVTEDGITFDSKHEWRVYRWLKARKERGELRWVFVHVPFRFMSGVVYWADFFTVLADGTVEAVWDAKSTVTAKNKDYVIKKKLLLTEWGIAINEVKRSDSDGRGGFYNPAWVYAYHG